MKPSVLRCKPVEFEGVRFDGSEDSARSVQMLVDPLTLAVGPDGRVLAIRDHGRMHRVEVGQWVLKNAPGTMGVSVVSAEVCSSLYEEV